VDCGENGLRFDRLAESAFKMVGVGLLVEVGRLGVVELQRRFPADFFRPFCSATPSS
jgi:hypothetical protein